MLQITFFDNKNSSSVIFLKQSKIFLYQGKRKIDYNCMEPHLSAKGTNFYTIGLSYKKADAEIRGRFSISEHAKEGILQQA